MRRLSVTARDALEGKRPQRQPQRRLNRQLEEVAKAVGGSLSVTNAVEAGTWRQGDSGWAPWRGGGGGFQCIPGHGLTASEKDRSSAGEQQQQFCR